MTLEKLAKWLINGGMWMIGVGIFIAISYLIYFAFNDSRPMGALLIIIFGGALSLVIGIIVDDIR
jgi:uncharacterized membrane protein